MTTSDRTFGMGDSAEQSLSIRISKAHQAANECEELYLNKGSLHNMVSYWLAAVKEYRLQAAYERLYGTYDPS